MNTDDTMIQIYEILHDINNNNNNTLDRSEVTEDMYTPIPHHSTVIN